MQPEKHLLSPPPLFNHRVAEPLFDASVELMQVIDRTGYFFSSRRAKVVDCIGKNGMEEEHEREKGGGVRRGTETASKHEIHLLLSFVC